MPNEVLTDDAVERLTQIIQEHKDQQGALVNVLHETQEYLGCVPYPAQKFIAEKMNIPITEIYGVVTFYSRFTLDPIGKYKINCCMGTACYVKGSDKVLQKLEETTGIKAGETSDDGLFTLEGVRCIGACGLAPVIMINEDVYGKLDPSDVEDIINKYKE